MWHARVEVSGQESEFTPLESLSWKDTVLRTDVNKNINKYTVRGKGQRFNEVQCNNGLDTKKVYEECYERYAWRISKEFFDPSVAVDVMVVPVAMRHEDPELQEKLGAVFLHLGTPEGIGPEVLERIYARIQSYWHFNMTSEILARRTAERDEALARERAFTLAEGPLGMITSALEATRESAQRLRALLHAPYAAFSGASSNVVGFFEEKKPVRIADRTVVVAHKAENYAEPERDPHDAAFVLLGILAEVFGEDPAGFRGIPELVGCVGDRVYGRDPAFAELREICVAIAGKEGEALWGYVCDAARRKDTKVPEDATDALGHFKRLLHTPYKFETDGYVIAPLAAVVLSHENSVFTVKWKDAVTKVRRCECYKTLKKFLASDATSLKMPILTAATHRLPCPRASFLWHALTCAMDKKVEVVVDCDAASITCSNAKAPNEPCLKNMKLLIEGGGGIGQVIGGDETAPWYAFAAACRPAKVKVKALTKGHCLIIASGGAKITIRSNVNTLTITLG